MHKEPARRALWLGRRSEDRPAGHSLASSAVSCHHPGRRCAGMRGLVAARGVHPVVMARLCGTGQARHRRPNVVRASLTSASAAVGARVATQAMPGGRPDLPEDRSVGAAGVTCMRRELTSTGAAAVTRNDHHRHVKSLLEAVVEVDLRLVSGRSSVRVRPPAPPSPGRSPCCHSR